MLEMLLHLKTIWGIIIHRYFILHFPTFKLFSFFRRHPVNSSSKLTVFMAISSNLQVYCSKEPAHIQLFTPLPKLRQSAKAGSLSIFCLCFNQIIKCLILNGSCLDISRYLNILDHVMCYVLWVFRPFQHTTFYTLNQIIDLATHFCI